MAQFTLRGEGVKLVANHRSLKSLGGAAQLIYDEFMVNLVGMDVYVGIPSTTQTYASTTARSPGDDGPRRCARRKRVLNLAVIEDRWLPCNLKGHRQVHARAGIEATLGDTGW